MRRWGGALSTAVGAMLLGACAALSGCGAFFVCAKSSCTTSSTGTSSTTTTGDYAYVSNSTSASTSLAGYDIGSGALTVLSGFPFALGYVPMAMKVSPNNSFLYIGDKFGEIYLYRISSAGVLSSASTSPQVVTASASLSSLDVSPDGAFLFAMDAAGALLTEYSLNTSSGALTLLTTFTVPGIASGCVLSGSPLSQSCTVSVSPLTGGAGYVAVALGTSGTVVFPYSTSAGIKTASYSAIACCSNGVASPSGDFSVAFDANDYLYIARTVTLSSYGGVANTTPTPVTNVSYSSGQTPRGVTVSNSSKYLYTANKGAGTISGFTLDGSGGLSALSVAPFTGPASVAALGVDSSGNYLIAAGYNATAGVQLFKPSSGIPGSAVASAGTGTDTSVPALLALTH